MTNKNQEHVIGKQWLPKLLTWGGILLMLTGGILAYPTLQNYLAPPDAQSLEFSITPASDTAPPLMVLPETELLPTVEQPINTPVKTQSGLQTTDPTTQTSTPQATSTATATPLPSPTVDPASLVPTRMVIPTIDLDTPVVAVGWETREINGQVVSNWIVPDAFAAGWHENSAVPGQVGNTVINGHHNIYGEVFRDLEDLEAGDEIRLSAGETVHYYSVTARHILKEKGEPLEVRIENASWILPSQDERLTLVTCWPYTNNTHRLIIVATPTSAPRTTIPLLEE